MSDCDAPAAHRPSIGWILEGGRPLDLHDNLETLCQDATCEDLLPLFNALCVAFPSRLHCAGPAYIKLRTLCLNVILDILPKLADLDPFLPHLRALEQRRIDGLCDRAEEVENAFREARQRGAVLRVEDGTGRKMVVVGVDPASGTARVAKLELGLDTFPAGRAVLTARQVRQTMRIGRFSSSDRIAYTLGARRDMVAILLLERFPEGTGHAYRAAPAPTATIRFCKNTQFAVVEPVAIDAP